MSRVRKVTYPQIADLRDALALLKQARERILAGGAPMAEKAVRRAIHSTAGALSYAERIWDRQQYAARSLAVRELETVAEAQSRRRSV